MRNAISPLMAGLAFILAASPAMAADPAKEEAQTRGDERKAKAAKEGERSPWLFVPLLSSSPKLDTAAGMMVGYLHQFDEGSRPSLFTLSGKYTTSESLITSAFAKTSFGADHHRIVGGVILGDINNSYEDYLGTGRALETNDNFRSAFLRYREALGEAIGEEIDESELSDEATIGELWRFIRDKAENAEL